MRIKFGLKEGVFKKLAVGIMLSVLLSAAACGSGIEFAPDSFKPSGTNYSCSACLSCRLRRKSNRKIRRTKRNRI